MRTEPEGPLFTEAELAALRERADESTRWFFVDDLGHGDRNIIYPSSGRPPTDAEVLAAMTIPRLIEEILRLRRGVAEVADHATCIGGDTSAPRAADRILSGPRT